MCLAWVMVNSQAWEGWRDGGWSEGGEEEALSGSYEHLGGFGWRKAKRKRRASPVPVKSVPGRSRPA